MNASLQAAEFTGLMLVDAGNVTFIRRSDDQFIRRTRAKRSLGADPECGMNIAVIVFGLGDQE